MKSILLQAAVLLFLIAREADASSIFVEMGANSRGEYTKFNGVEMSQAEIIALLDDTAKKFGKRDIGVMCSDGATVSGLLKMLRTLSSHVKSYKCYVFDSRGKPAEFEAHPLP